MLSREGSCEKHELPVNFVTGSHHQRTKCSLSSVTGNLAVCLGHDSESKFCFVCEVAIEAGQWPWGQSPRSGAEWMSKPNLRYPREDGENKETSLSVAKRLHRTGTQAPPSLFGAWHLGNVSSSSYEL